MSAIRHGELMRAWRERDGVTLGRAWAAIGVSATDARRYERGERVPPGVRRCVELVGIARLYGVPVFKRR